MRQNAYPESLTHGDALARIHELRRQAEHERLVRSVRTARQHSSTSRGPVWPAALAASLRESLAMPSMPSNSRTPAACATCS